MDEATAPWSTSIVLADGDTAFIRPITADDAPLLLAFHERQPRDNQYRRFLSPKPTLSPKELDHFTRVDMHDRVALVVEDRGEFIAWASYERWKDRDDAEVAFMVDDQHQGRGIAALLLEHLAAIARTNGIQRFTAEAFSDNRAMLRVFSRAGWPVERHFESGLTEVEFPLGDTEQFVDSVEAREQRADSRSVARMLLAKSMAVIGASDREGTVGEQLWTNAIRSFEGPVYAVNPSHERLSDQPVYRSVTDIVDDVWLAVIAVPAGQLVETINECISKRVRGAVVVTSTDGTDIDMPAVVAHARRNGLRLIGPASMGVASPRLIGGMNVALLPGTLPYGNVAISMQSGSLGASVLTLAAQLEMGISWFVSLGDKCDISGNDLLQFWEDDESTRVIALYTETFGNPRKFARIARRVGRTRPIVAVRTGAAAIGHGATALYQQAGLIEVPTVRAMLDTARVLASQPIPAGPNVAIITNSRSPGVLAEAATKAAGLVAVDPPLRLDWRSSDDDFARAVDAAADDDSVHSIMVIHAPPLATTRAPDHQIDAAAQRSTKPVVAIMLGRDDGPLCEGSLVPSFSFPEPAAAALGRMHAYSRWLRTEAHSPFAEIDGIDSEAAARMIATASDDARAVLAYDESAKILAAYGVSSPRGAATEHASPDEIAEVAARIGFPVVVKAARRRVGRSARAGIALDLANREQVRAAVEVIREALGTDATSMVVQQMTPPGVDVHIHCGTDPVLGPVITIGLGSLQTAADIDGVSRLAPVSQAAAETMIESSQVGRALVDADIDSARLVDTIMRVALLMADHHDLTEIDINPVIVSADACLVTDARVSVDHAEHSELPLRRLV